MWAMRLKDGTIRSMSAKYMEDKKCALCGQYFKPNDKYCIIVIPFEYRSKHKKLKNNLVCHTDEWLEFAKDVTTYDEMAERIIKHKIPRKKAFTEQELFKINCFRKACVDYGFREEFEKPFGLKMKKSGSSLYLIYNVYQDSIDLDYRGNKGLFDSFYTREIIAKVYNRMHEYLGDGLKDNYSMQEDFKKLNDEVNKFMDKMN